MKILRKPAVPCWIWLHGIPLLGWQKGAFGLIGSCLGSNCGGRPQVQIWGAVGICRSHKPEKARGFVFLI